MSTIKNEEPGLLDAVFRLRKLDAIGDPLLDTGDEEKTLCADNMRRYCVLAKI
jgi:hypothetical protein